MLSEHDFIEWLKGFVAGSPHITPEGWIVLKGKLAEVYSNEVLDILKDPNTFRVPQYPFYADPIPCQPVNPYTYPYIGDPPGWLTGPWQVNSTSAGYAYTKITNE
jgi:hypothetical protein